MVNGHSAFKPTAVLAPNRRVSLTFEAFQPGSDFPSLAVKVLDGVFFRLKTVSSALKPVVRVAAFMHCLCELWVPFCSRHVSTCCFTSHSCLVEATSVLSISPASLCPLQLRKLLYPSQLSKVEGSLKEPCSWFDLLFRPLKLFLYQH